MPTYSYECRKCGLVVDLFHSITANPRVKCAKCGGACKRKLGTGAGIIFKGSGFYETDYKRAGIKGGTEAKAEAESKRSESAAQRGEPAAGAKSADAKSEAKSGESKGAESKGSESKGESKGGEAKGASAASESKGESSGPKGKGEAKEKVGAKTDSRPKVASKSARKSDRGR